MEFYNLSSEDVLEQLNTSKTEGLARYEVIRRASLYGKNAILPENEGFLYKFIDHLKEPLVIILLLCGFALFVTGNFLLGLSILIAVLSIQGIIAFQDLIEEKQMDSLLRDSKQKIQSIRSGKIVRLFQTEITVGDIVLLEPGIVIPADGRILHCENLKVSEFLLSGDKTPIVKSSETLKLNRLKFHDQSNMVFSGSNVLEGFGTFVVTSIGAKTELQKQGLVRHSSSRLESPIENHSFSLHKRFSLWAGILALFFFVVEIYKVFQGTGYVGSFELLEHIIFAFCLVVTILFAVVPLNIASLTSIFTTFKLKNLFEAGIALKRPSVLKSLLHLDVLLLNANHLLRENNFQVKETFSAGRLNQITSINSFELLENICVNSTAHFLKDPEGNYLPATSPEMALLKFAGECDINYLEFRQKYPKLSGRLLPTSDKRLMTTSMEYENGYRIYSKGSFEDILGICTRIKEFEAIIPLTEAKKQEVEASILELENAGKIVVAFCYKDISRPLMWHSRLDVERNMTFLGFIAIENPIRENVAKQLHNFISSGIDVKIFTTEQYRIANTYGSILKSGDKEPQIYVAKDLEVMFDKDFSSNIEHLSVLAESNSMVLNKMIRTLQNAGRTVAITTVDDIDPTLANAADLSISFEGFSSESAKDLSDIIINRKDIFSSISTSIGWVLALIDDLKKPLRVQRTLLLSLLVFLFLTEITGYGLIFSPMQFLWIALLQCGPLFLAYSFSKDESKSSLTNDNVVQKKLFKSTELMQFEPSSKVNMLLNALFISFSLFAVVLINPWEAQTPVINLSQSAQRLLPIGENAAESSTIVLTAFVLFQLWHAINCLSPTENSLAKLFKNRVFSLTLLGYGFCYLLMSQPLGFILNTELLGSFVWIKLILLTSSIFFLNELCKLILRVFHFFKSNIASNPINPHDPMGTDAE